MLSGYAGQMLRHMLLWDCEKSGYTRYQFMTEGNNCEECSSLDGQVFDIKDAKSGKNLAPMHPNCDCGAAVLDKNGGVVMMVGGKESKQNNQNTYNKIFAPVLRIPKDAAKMLKSYYNAQVERAQKIKNPLSFLDWVTMGMVSGAWQGMQQRADKMLETPSAYNIANWLTMGLLDTAKGAINPDEPLSLEHWLDSAALAGTVVGAYKAGKVVDGNSNKTRNFVADKLDENIKVNPDDVKINQGKQDKHIVGTNNYNLSLKNGVKRSILKENPQKLLDEHAGLGTFIAENKEWVDFGKVIGQYYDINTGTYVNTTKGIIHYDSKGSAHIVPANPKGMR